MRVIISGAGGFLGKNIIMKAIVEHIEVIALTSQSRYLKQEFGNQIEVVESDRYEEIKTSKTDVFINCAFPRSNDGLRMAEGLRYTKELLTYVAGNAIGGIINISSQSVYGAGRSHTVSESEELCLDTIYAVGKYSSELLTNAICSDRLHTNIRLASLIGVGFDQRFINRMLKSAKAGRTVQANIGNQVYGYLDVRDAADALLILCSQKEKKWKEVYNIGADQPSPMRDIIKCVEEVANIKVDCKSVDESFNSHIDSSLFYSDTGWVSSFGLMDTIRDIYENM